MAETIESFVTKLRTEGVEQGRQEAEHLRSEAQREAERIVAEAKGQADKIVADANAEAANIMARSRTELELAARDAVLKLREALQKALESAITGPVETQLNDAQFLKDMIEFIAKRFVEADIDSYAPARVNVSAEMHRQLSEWALGRLRAGAKESSGAIELKESLRQAGFEFSLHGATIEITKDSVIDILMQLVSPSLRAIISTQTEGGK